MELLPFLTQLTSPAALEPYSLVIFQAKEPYPMLFSSALRLKLGRVGIPTEVLPLESLDFTLLRSTLETSFLGMSGTYWLSITELDERKQRQLVTYLAAYQGQHKIFVCVDEELAALLAANTKSLLINIPPHLTEKTFTECAHRLYQPHLLKTFPTYSTMLFKRRLNIPLDTACLLMQYGIVLGTGMPQFIAQWLDKIVVADASLFTLSQYFFARDTQRFFNSWRAIKDDYAEPFWLTYWSEQLWRACMVVQLQQAHETVEAKKISFRLPFSFMQKDWRNYSTGELKQAHQFVYTLDYGMKNGGMCPMELLYTKFFVGEFR